MTRLLKREIEEASALIGQVYSATDTCAEPNKEMVINSLKNLLKEQFENTKWREKWRLELFREVDDDICLYKEHYKENDIIANMANNLKHKICSLMGKIIYRDLQLESLNSDLFINILIEMMNYYSNKEGKQNLKIKSDIELIVYTVTRGNYNRSNHERNNEH